jgi:hypothetical protein
LRKSGSRDLPRLGPVVAGAAADRFGPAVVPLVAFAIYAAGAVAATIDGLLQRTPAPYAVVAAPWAPRAAPRESS